MVRRIKTTTKPTMRKTEHRMAGRVKVNMTRSKSTKMKVTDRKRITDKITQMSTDNLNINKLINY